MIYDDFLKNINLNLAKKDEYHISILFFFSLTTFKYIYSYNTLS